MTKTQPRVIAIGEAMAMVAPTRAEPLETATAVRLDVAGAESNVACHVAALGHPTAWVGRVGDDALGRKVRRMLEERGVRLSWVQVDPDASTGVMFKDPGQGVHYFRDGSAGSRMGPGILGEVPLRHADYVHLTGITPALSPSCADLVEATIAEVSSTPSLLSFDVNYRRALWSTSRAASTLLAIAQRADVVFVGLDEAIALWGTATPDDVRALVDAPQRLVIKDGDVGATEFSSDGRTFAPALQTAVVEEVGAGDAFAAGYLAACLSGAGPTDRLLAGHARAVLVMQSTSDFVDAVEHSSQAGGTG